MATEVSENTKFTLDLKTISLIVGFSVSLATTYFSLKSDIALAMEKPEPVITQQEYQYKDEIVRQTIMLTQQDVDGIKDDVQEIKESLKVLEERLYEIN
jgi:hypothetical protein|tara:strand:- start:2746 stop:3042 length:297 start_codon:yes stop_codon:yes gene_type:complete